MNVVRVSEHPTAVIIADGELARKGFKYYADAAGLSVEPVGAPADVVLRGPDTGGDIDAPLHVIVDAHSIRIEPHHDIDPATIVAALRLIGVLLTGWNRHDG